MLELEKHISPLIKNMFPSFYQEDGENFIAFVEAYFEFLEQNYQVLVLTDSTGFEVGDTVTQGPTTGTIISVDSDLGSNSILVRLDSFDTFRCFDMNTEYEDLISSSGATTFILHGGRGKRVTPIYWARHLAQLRDIDRTIDSFILNFKEKYLKNIEFDTSTNKQLLVKNSLDLYRSKGTERSIDLFFRLIYGVKAQVYYPGEDLFKLSAAEWVRPLYLEISASPRSVDLVGKQIVGVSSGATGFVERYIKRRVKDSFVYILYVTNTSGTFETNEVVYHETIHADLPIIKGSLSNVTIVNGSREFEVGDIVHFNSSYGDFGLARVSAISSETGQVEFIFEDGGYGYTVSDDPNFTQNDLAKRTQSIVSEKVLALNNVVVSNVVSAITVTAGGTGYNNTDVVSVVSPFSNCIATPTTNSTGGILYITVDNPGSGFYTNTPGPVVVANSTGGVTAGSGATLVAGSKAQTRYFQYFESFNQNIKNVAYNNASNNQLFAVGNRVTIGNSTVTVATGTVIGNANGALVDANGVLTIGVANNGSFAAGNTIYLTSNLSVTANAGSVADASAIADIMGRPESATLSLTAVSGTFNISDEIYQERTGLEETANATIISTNITGTTGIIDVEDLQGVFVTGLPVLIRNKASSGTITNVQLNVGVYNIANSYLDAGGAQVFSTNTGTTANLITISQGTGASFKVGSITESEIIYLNTDLLSGINTSNTPYLDIRLNANTYGFPKNPTGNASAVIFSCLNFDSFTIGTIGTLTSINPGSDYNIDPFVLAYQPYLSSFNRYDYIFEIENLSGSFVSGERLLQTNTLLTTHTLVVANDAGLEVGMKVNQGGAANGLIIEHTAAANTITLRDVQGTFAANATPLTSFSNVSISTLISSANTTSVTQTAKGIVKSANSTHVLVKRIEFSNKWEEGLQIRGNLSGATANIVTIMEDSSYLPIGLNANVLANVTTADGTVTNLQITNSGFGYREGDEISFISSDGFRAGTAISGLAGLGRGSGYYKTSKGFLSTTSKLQDGDYYQEYSYEVLSRIPLDKYSEMFKKVMHTAGTRYFGGVLLESTRSNKPTVADSVIRIDDANELNFSNTVNSGYVILLFNE